MAIIEDYAVHAVGDGRYEVRKAGKVVATSPYPDVLQRMFPGTGPHQPLLDAWLACAARVRVWSGDAENDVHPDARCLADIDDPAALTALRALFPLALGSGVVTWNDFPAYELCAEVLLRTFPRDLLLAQVAADTLDERQLDGVTRLIVVAEHEPMFPPWAPLARVVRPASVAPIAVPVAVHARLVAHCRSSARVESRLADRFRVLAGG